MLFKVLHDPESIKRNRTEAYPILQLHMNENNSKKLRKEGNVLFNDALNTFYLQLYGVGSKEIFTNTSV